MEKSEGRKPLLEENGKVLSFYDVKCWLTYRESIYSCHKKKKQILHSLCGIAKPGEILAIMGPSGSGKTTLLDVIAHRNFSGLTVTGEIFVNKKNGQQEIVNKGAYVTQEDILFSSLTVRETMKYAALLRLPRSISYDEKMKRVDQVLEMLDLTAIQHSKVGGTLIRGISGGEKRRLSIGIEIITDPSILLADEITSGLDSFAALSVFKVLKKMAEKGVTIITTIHQPSSQIYQMFDKLLLLSSGKMVYYGKANLAIDYFDKLGYTLPAGWNPADYFLDIISSDSSVKNSKSFLIKSFQEISNRVNNGNIIPQNNNNGYDQYLNEESISIDNSESLHSQIMNYHPSAAINVDTNISNSAISSPPLFDICGKYRHYSTPFYYQIYVLMCRNFLRLSKDPMIIAQMFISYLFSAILMSLMFSNLQSNVENQLTLCLSFMINLFGINAFFSVGSFLQESTIYRREYVSSYYSTSSYFLSKILCFMPINFIICSIYSLILFYWLGIANRDWNQFVVLLLLNYLTMETFLALNEIFGITFTNLQNGILAAGLINTILMLFNGVFINYPNIPSYLQWLYWCVFTTYGMSGVMLLEYNNSESGQQWLKIFGVQVSDEWTCVYALFAFFILFRILGYLALRFVGKSRG